jgi:predicted GNAT family N-acyltransferase
VEADAETLVETETLGEPHIRDLWELFRNEWWTKSRSLDETRRIVAGSSVNLGVLDGPEGRLVAYTRVLSDFIVKALVLDVIVAPSHRGLQLGKRQIERVVHHPSLANVAHFELYCRPELMPFYERWGFTATIGDINFMRRSSSTREVLT